MGGENPFGKGLIEIILCSRTGSRQGKGFTVAMVHNRGILRSFRDHRMALLTGNTINERLQAMLPSGSGLQIPPACLLDMQGEPLEYEEGAFLSVRFPVLPRYANPLGHMQGGFIVAALDNTLGPFSYLIAPPSVTASLNTQYLRPVTPETRFITCLARLVERTRATLYLTGEARNPEGKVVAMCQATCQILPTKG
jgi:uncharacterized protein (TIGR00369 family)